VAACLLNEEEALALLSNALRVLLGLLLSQFSRATVTSVTDHTITIEFSWRNRSF
jgi:hypothetical protein